MIYSFDTDLAKEIGLSEAIFVNNLVYWLKKNKANNKHIYDGRVWTYNSRKAYAELFEFWSESQIKRIIGSLVEQGVVLVGNYNTNPYDHTNWYALSDEYIQLIGRHETPDWTKSSDHNRYTDINTDTKTTKEKKPSSNPYKQFLEALKTECKYKSKLEYTKSGEEAYKTINNKELLSKAYILHQHEKREFAKRITAFMMDFVEDDYYLDSWGNLVKVEKATQW
jgi:hypothetical protein